MHEHRREHAAEQDRLPLQRAGRRREHPGAEQLRRGDQHQASNAGQTQVVDQTGSQITPERPLQRGNKLQFAKAPFQLGQQ